MRSPTRPHLGLLTALSAAALASHASAQLDRAYSVLAWQGQSTPSAGEGASYGIISSDPVIGAGGHVAFAGFVSNGDGNFAVWSGLPGSIEKLAITNDPAPGRPGTALDIFGVGQIRTNPDGSTAFRAGLIDSADSGIWIGTPGALEEVAIVNNQVNGLPAGTLYQNHPGFVYVCNGDGEVAIRATVNVGGETVLLSGPPDEFGVVAREDDFLPDQPATRYGSLTFIGFSMNSHGQVLASVPLQTGDLSNNNALMSGTPDDFEILFQEGDPVEGIPGAEFDAFKKPRIADDGGLVFVDNPRGIDIERTLFYYHPDDGLHVLASEGEPAVGAPGSTYAGLFFPSPLVSSNGWAAFRAGLEPDASFDRDGIWVAHHGQVELVAKKADPAPGLSGAVFTTFSEPVINDRGVLVFKAETTGESGIWLWDRGMLRLVLTKNDRIPVSHPTETVGIVRNFSLKTGTGTQDGYGSSLNDDCQLAVQVGFQIQIPSAIVLIPNLRDLDGDGIDCLLEDAFGSDCNDPADGAATIPHAQLDGDKLLIRFRRLQGASPYEYQVECSTDLDDWQPTGISPTLADDQSAAPPGVEIVEVAVPLDADTEKFLRVRVTLDPG